MIYIISTGQQKDANIGDVVLVVPGLFKSNVFAGLTALFLVDNSSDQYIGVMEINSDGFPSGDIIYLSPGWVFDFWREVQ